MQKIKNNLEFKDFFKCHDCGSQLEIESETIYKYNKEPYAIIHLVCEKCNKYFNFELNIYPVIKNIRITCAIKEFLDDIK